MLTSLFSLFYVTGEIHRFLHRGRAKHKMVAFAKRLVLREKNHRFLSKTSNGTQRFFYSVTSHAVDINQFLLQSKKLSLI